MDVENYSVEQLQAIIDYIDLLETEIEVFLPRDKGLQSDYLAALDAVLKTLRLHKKDFFEAMED